MDETNTEAGVTNKQSAPSNGHQQPESLETVPSNHTNGLATDSNDAKTDMKNTDTIGESISCYLFVICIIKGKGKAGLYSILLYSSM